MKNKVWLLVLTVFLFVVGCNSEVMKPITGEYINSGEVIKIIYEKDAYENYLNLPEKEKQEKLKKIVNNNEYIEGTKEVKKDKTEAGNEIFVITESNFSIEIQNVLGIEPIKFDNPFHDMKVMNVMKLDLKLENESNVDTQENRNGHYFVLEQQKLYAVEEKEDYIRINLFYAKGSSEYESIIREYEMTASEIDDETGQQFPVAYNSKTNNGIDISMTKRRLIAKMGYPFEIKEIMEMWSILEAEEKEKNKTSEIAKILSDKVNTWNEVNFKIYMYKVVDENNHIGELYVLLNENQVLGTYYR